MWKSKWIFQYALWTLKRPIRSDTSILLCRSQHGLSELLQASSYMLCGSHKGFPNFEVIQDSYRLCSNENGPSKDIQASYAICDNQNGLSELLQPYYTLCGSQNGLSAVIQSPYTFCGSQNSLSKHLEASYTLYGSQLILRISTNHQHALRKSKRPLLSLLHLLH